jgi:ELWxxDGT repeat protein
MLATAVSARRLLLAVALVATPLPAQPAAMVKDIGTEFNDFTSIFSGGSLGRATLNGVGYLPVDDGVHGFELWRSDGTVADTALVADVCPGICDGVSAISPIVAWNGAIYFIAADGVHGYELWRTDGSAAGTALVADIRPGMPSAFGLVERPELFATPSRLFFAADGQGLGVELWSTLGTAATTALVKDINLAGSSYPQAYLDRGGQLLLFADDGIHGNELWRSDGTDTGTVLVRDLVPGPGSSGVGFAETLSLLPGRRVALGSLALFSEGNGSGEHLWRSDGTEGGTTLVYSSAGAIRGFAVFAGKVYFASEGALWATDGSSAGTSQVSNAAFFFGAMVGLPSQLLLIGSDALHGVEPWVSDGTAAGTQLLADINPGAASSFSLVYLPKQAGSPTLFWATDGVHGAEMWRTDGSPAGTNLVADLVPGVESSLTSPLGALPVDLGPRQVFAARFTVEHSGKAIWSTDGTAAGTSLLTSLAEQTHAPYRFASFVYPPPVGGPPGAVLGQYALFPNGWPLWFSDGTQAGTQVVAPAVDISGRPAIWLGGSCLFWVVDAGMATLWASDGAPGSNTALHSWPGSPGLGWVVWGAHAYFPAPDGTLWRTDGTVAGTELVDSAQSGAIAGVGAYLYFMRTLSQNPPAVELLRTTVALGPAESLGVLPNVNGIYPTNAGPVLFSQNGATVELRRVTESPLGTAVVDSWLPATVPGVFGLGAFPASTGSRLFFERTDGGDAELWVTDGTTMGTHRVIDLAPGPRGSFPRDLTVWGSDLFFVADDAVHGRELFATDGTEAGTRLVADIIPGPKSSHPKDLAVPNGYLIFSATDGIANRELWVSSGTAAGTFRLQDIAPGALPSSPQGFTLGNNRIFFLANDATHGFELWSMAAAQSAIRVTLEAVPAAAGAATGTTEAPGSIRSNGSEFGFIGRAVLTCTNDGPSPAANVSCALVNPPPGTTIDCTPPTPAAQLGVGQSIVCQVSFPWSGPVVLTGSASSTTSDPFPSDNLATLTLAAPAEFEEIPTLSQVGLALMALALVVAAVGYLSTRRRPGQG